MTDQKPWQKGIDLETLQGIARVFKAYEKHVALGAFSGYRETDIASALTDPGSSLKLVSTAEGPVAAIHVREARQNREIRDFAGTHRANLQRGDLQVKRIACLEGHEQSLLAIASELQAGGRRVWWETWQEHPTDRMIARALQLEEVCVKIKASSELVAIYAKPAAQTFAAHPADRFTLTQLYPFQGSAYLPEAIEALGRAGDFAQHYSSYNKRSSWTALALRGYADDPAFIIKPAEMAKKWKAENEELLEAELRDTPLREQLPEFEPLISEIPGPHHRIRLMQLAPGGGELERHADNTDPDAGTNPGQLLRIHIPIVTNPQVLFEAWDLAGNRLQAHMQAGSAWYLDTRKPHRAYNMGDAPRVHLVIDTESSPDLLALLNREALVSRRPVTANPSAGLNSLWGSGGGENGGEPSEAPVTAGGVEW